MEQHAFTAETQPKPHIILDINPVHEAFCRYIFKCGPNDEAITINRKHDIGKLISSAIITADRQELRPLGKHPVTFILPTNEDNCFLKDRFIKVSEWGEQKIQDGITAEFNLWIKRRYEIGYEMNMEKKQIVEAILRGLNLRNQVVNFDAIKKNDYRNRRRMEEKRFQILLTGSYSD